MSNEHETTWMGKAPGHGKIRPKSKQREVDFGLIRRRSSLVPLGVTCLPTCFEA